MIETYPADKSSDLKGYFADNERFKPFINMCFRQSLGKFTVDDLDSPSVILVSYNGINVFTGDHNRPAIIKEMMRGILDQALIVPNQKWSVVLEEICKKLYVQNRMEFSASSLDLEHVKKLKKLPEGYILNQLLASDGENLDKVLFNGILQGFDSYSDFIEKGIGYCIRDVSNHNRIVSFASSGFPYKDTLEIQVMTLNSDQYRMKGLATSACAALIEYCLKRDIEPHYDAANPVSCKLAEKLGYINPDPWKLFSCLSNDEER